MKSQHIQSITHISLIKVIKVIIRQLVSRRLSLFLVLLAAELSLTRLFLLPAKGALAVLHQMKFVCILIEFLLLFFSLLFGQLFALLLLLLRRPDDLFSIFDAIFFTGLEAASTAVVWACAHPASDSTTCGGGIGGRGRGGKLLLLGFGSDHGLAAHVIGDRDCPAAAAELVLVFRLVPTIRGLMHFIDRF